MEQPYLIQRAKLEKHPNERAVGIDRLLDFDYMGSSEFEYGALPDSLKQVRAEIDAYKMYDYVFKNNPSKSVTVYCKATDEKEVNGFLEQLSKNKIRLKEVCDLSEYVSGERGYRNSDFWWDIDNHFFFWKPNEDFSIKFQGALMEKTR